MSGPLDGVRVLDLTRVVMGPLATQILADQGADVVLVEADGMDVNRVMGPQPRPGLSAVALNLLRNKKSVRLDLKSAEGRSAVERLIADSDVVVTTMRPAALRELRLDYESVAAVRPDVVYCQAQGFALDGPRADDPAYDDIIQVATGVPDMMERVWGEPMLIPTILADKVCGIVMAQAISAALVGRARTGRGQHIEVSMAQAMASFMLVEHGAGAICEPPLEQGDGRATGYRRVMSAERRPHRTSDGAVHLLPYLRKHYVDLFTFAGRTGVEEDERLVGQATILAESDSLYRDVREIARTRTTDEWLAYCRAAEIPATPVVTLEELARDLPLSTHPTAGDYRVIPPMANFRGESWTVRSPAPDPGEHTHEILGSSEAEPSLARPGRPSPVRRSRP